MVFADSVWDLMQVVFFVGIGDFVVQFGDFRITELDAIILLILFILPS